RQRLARTGRQKRVDLAFQRQSLLQLREMDEEVAGGGQVWAEAEGRAESVLAEHARQVEFPVLELDLLLAQRCLAGHVAGLLQAQRDPVPRGDAERLGDGVVEPGQTLFA